MANIGGRKEKENMERDVFVVLNVILRNKLY